MSRQLVVWAALAALGLASCEEKSVMIGSTATDDAVAEPVADFSSLTRELQGADGKVCTNQLVKDQLREIALNAITSFSDWSREDLSAFKAAYQSDIAGVTFGGFDEQTKLTTCSGEYSASANGDGWQNGITYTVQPVLDGPMPRIVIQDMRPVWTVNNHVLNNYDADFLRADKTAAVNARASERYWNSIKEACAELRAKPSIDSDDVYHIANLFYQGSDPRNADDVAARKCLMDLRDSVPGH